MGNVTAISLKKREGNCTEPGPTTCGGVNTRYLDEVGPIPAVILPSGPYCLEKKFGKNLSTKVHKRASTSLPSKTPPPPLPSTLPSNSSLFMHPPPIFPQMGSTYGPLTGPQSMAPGCFYCSPIFPRPQMPIFPRFSQCNYQQMQPDLPPGAQALIYERKKSEELKKRSRTEIFEELARVLIQKRQEDEVLQKVAQEIVDSNQKHNNDDIYAQYTPPVPPPAPPPPPPSPPQKMCKTVVKPIICCRCKRKSPQKKSIKAICNMKKNLNDLMKKNYMLTLENHLLYEMVIKHKLEKETASKNPPQPDWSDTPQGIYPSMYCKPSPPPQPPSACQRRFICRGRSLPPNESRIVKCYYREKPCNTFRRESRMKGHRNSDFCFMDSSDGLQEYDKGIDPCDLSQYINELCASICKADVKEEPKDSKEPNGTENASRKKTNSTSFTAAATKKMDDCLYVLVKEPTINGLPCYNVSLKKPIDDSQGQNLYVVDPSSKNNQKLTICLNPFNYSTTKADINTAEKMRSCDDKCYVIQKPDKKSENCEMLKNTRVITSAPDLSNNNIPSGQTTLDEKEQKTKKDSIKSAPLKMHQNLAKKIENDESFCICQSVPCKTESCSSLIMNIASLIKSVKVENSQTQPKQQPESKQDDGQTSPKHQSLSDDPCKTLAQSLVLNKLSQYSQKCNTLPHQKCLLNSFGLNDPTSPLTDLDYERSALKKLCSTLPQLRRTIDYCNFDYEIDHCMSKNSNWIQNDENACRNLCKKKIENYIKKKGKDSGRPPRYQSQRYSSNDCIPLCTDMEFLSSSSCECCCVESDQDELCQKKPRVRRTSVQTDPISSLEPRSDQQYPGDYYGYPGSQPPNPYQPPYSEYENEEGAEKPQSQYRKASQYRGSFSPSGAQVKRPYQSSIKSTNPNLTAQNTRTKRTSAIQFADQDALDTDQREENEATSLEVPSERPSETQPPNKKKKTGCFSRKKKKTS